MQQRRDIVHVAHRGGFGDLDLQLRGRDRGRLEGSADRPGKAHAGTLPGRHVDRHRHRLQPAAFQRATCPQASCSVHSPMLRMIPLFRRRDEQIRRNRSLARLAPAQQRLEPTSVPLWMSICGW